MDPGFKSQKQQVILIFEIGLLPQAASGCFFVSEPLPWPFAEVLRNLQHEYQHQLF